MTRNREIWMAVAVAMASQMTQTLGFAVQGSTNSNANGPSSIGWGVGVSQSLSPLSQRTTCLSVSASPTDTDSKLDGEDEGITIQEFAELSEEEILAEFDDEDDVDDEEFYLSKKGEWMDELRRLAKTSAMDPTAVDQAQAVFDNMFEAYVKTEETTMWPSVDVYNLLLETHAYSKAPDGGEQAEKLLGRMEDEAVEFIARPNLKTYLKVMDAWAMRRNPEKAEAVLRRLEQRYQDTEDEAVQPTADAYNKLIKAHGMEGQVEKAEEVFRSLLEKEDEDDPLRANYKSWVQIMKTFAPRPDGTEKTQALFQEMLKAYRMGEEEYEPKTAAYNVLIRALGQQPTGAEEAESMLFDMINQYRAGDEAMRPNGETFRNVLGAQRRRKNVSAAKVEQLLQIQEGLYGNTKAEDLKPDGRIYNIALHSISRSRDAKKAVRARRIVDKLRESETDSPTIRTYFNLLSACAFTIGTPEENLEAFQIAVDALKELRGSLDREPDSSCFGMFLKACGNLMPESRKRDAVIEKVFRKCCSDGLVDEFVIAEFGRASSNALQLEVLGGFLDDDVRLPEEWSRNVETGE